MLSQVNIELADEKGLKPVFSFIVERKSSILPTLESNIMSLLGTRPCLVLELLRHGQDITGTRNTITLVITIE